MHWQWLQCWLEQQCRALSCHNLNFWTWGHFSFKVIPLAVLDRGWFMTNRATYLTVLKWAQQTVPHVEWTCSPVFLKWTSVWSCLFFCTPLLRPVRVIRWAPEWGLSSAYRTRLLDICLIKDLILFRLSYASLLVTLQNPKRGVSTLRRPLPQKSRPRNLWQVQLLQVQRKWVLLVSLRLCCMSVTWQREGWPGVWRRGQSSWDSRCWSPGSGVFLP